SDVCSSDLPVAHLAGAEPVRLLGGAVYLVYTTNSGAAFGLGRSHTYLFAVIAFAVIGWIAWMARRLRSLPWAVALGLLTAGAAGNLLDRLFRGPGGRHDQRLRPRRQRLPGLQRRRLGADHRGRDRALAGAERSPPRRHPPPVGPVRGHPGGRAVVDRTRALPVPDGLDGSRLDVAIARVFGLSRSTAAALVEAGEARVDGAPRSKSDRIAAGAWLEVTLPPPPVPAAPPPEPVA